MVMQVGLLNTDQKYKTNCALLSLACCDCLRQLGSVAGFGMFV